MKDDLPFLYHILDEIKYIKEKTTSRSCDDIRQDKDLSRSIPKSLVSCNTGDFQTLRVIPSDGDTRFHTGIYHL